MKPTTPLTTTIAVLALASFSVLSASCGAPPAPSEGSRMAASWDDVAYLGAVAEMHGDVEWHALSVADAGTALEAVDFLEETHVVRTDEHLSSIVAEAAGAPEETIDAIATLASNAGDVTRAHASAVYAAGSREEVADAEAEYQGIMLELFASFDEWRSSPSE